MTTVESALDRFMAKVEKTDTCWLWTSWINKYGYGEFWLDGNARAHRVAYLLFIGPIPEGKVIDHLCRVRHCVNPGHLEPVMPLQNTLRGASFQAVNAAKTHCVHGHPFDEKNTIHRKTRAGSGTRRDCRACQLAYNEKRNRMRALKRLREGNAA